jgi:Ala-tRNA(Pro) deacylase
MAIAPTLQKYLAAEDIQYEVIRHELSMTSTRTAEACHISGDRLAQPDVYMEAGDHETLLHMGHAQFARLTASAPHGRFSAHH